MSYVEELIGQIKTDPSVVTKLYPALTKEEYWVLVSADYKNVETARFISYDCPDGVRETAIFTSKEFKVLQKLQLAINSRLVQLPGKALFKRLLDFVDEETQLAINPGWYHGIRIPRSLLFSINIVGEEKH